MFRAPGLQCSISDGLSRDHGDIAETAATHEVFGERIPISSLKSYTGHTLGACGALEAWITLEMLREGWFHPTVNLREKFGRRP